MVAAGVHPKVVSGRPSVTPPRVFRPGKVRPCDAGQEEAAGKINAGLGAALAGKRSARRCVALCLRHFARCSLRRLTPTSEDLQRVT